MKTVPLGEVAQINMGSAPPSLSYNSVGAGVPLIAGAGDFGKENPVQKKWTTEPTRITEIGDLIVCVRATIGNLNWANKKYCLGRGVAGIRSKNDKIDLNFAFHYINSKKNELVKLGTGSTFLAIRKADLEKFPFPDLGLKEQKRIAEILDKADGIRKKREEALKLADSFLRATFLDMFGDPVTNPKEWERKGLNDVGILRRGKSKHRPRNAPDLLGGPYPLIQTGDIANSHHFVTQYKQTYSELGLKQSMLWPKKTLCITIAANIGDTAILTFDACFPDSIVGFIPNGSVKTEYIHMWLTFYQNIIREKAPESAQKNINLKILSELKIPIPPISRQKKFVYCFKQVELLKVKMRDKEKDLEDCFNSLTQRAFRGEL